ncbi:MAG: hypothetical protein JETT_0512 [Candidatus Jettenia ecosi]|uniref:Uncharacterized protein n=1 Tax=Candidatus Jettenia ecosi TaxID=2494326 RepID=A0A533QEM8_9BACT|nr:MAG: hypothetical protein JETT_0512 [Candidatus Jettenia ecosi]
MNGKPGEHQVEAGKEGNQFLDAVYWRLIISDLHHFVIFIAVA